MFCQKCGNQVVDNAKFCRKCGALIAGDDSIQHASTEPVSIASPKPVELTQEATPETFAQESVPAADTDEFREFVDNHIRTTTKFKSADDLLKNCKPLTFIWICLGVSFLVGSLMSFPIGGFLFLILGFVAAFIAGGVIRGRYRSKTAGEFDGKIDTDELLRFLNEHLAYLHPYLHEWGYMEQSGTGLYALSASVSAAMKEVILCAAFGSKKKRLATICIRPETANPESGQMKYIFGAENNGVSFYDTNAGFMQHICLIKTAPILQAAMEYYTKLKSSQGAVAPIQE
ncbi:MAG: zinc ribbon domain-containing protein [Treponema sp.]|jgi:hypothetical protein|nr:zinc ribbon domain-containing protein [Treponema sp.]